VDWSFNYGTDFFVTEWVDLTASWSCEVVSLCLYALIPAFLSLMKEPLVVTFCNSPQLSCHVGLNLFNVIKSVSFHCFLQLHEQEEVTRSKVRGVGRVWEWQNVVFCQKFICGDSPVGRSIVMVQDPIAGAPFLRTMSAHSIVEVLQDCSVEFLIYCLSFRNLVMMNQPINVEKRNQHGLDIGLHLLHFLRSRRRCCVTLGCHLLCFRVIPVNPAFVTSDYWGHEVGILLGSLMEVSANCSAIRRQDTNFAVTLLICKSSVRIFWHIPNATLTSSATSLNCTPSEILWSLQHDTLSH